MKTFRSAAVAVLFAAAACGGAQGQSPPAPAARDTVTRLGDEAIPPGYGRLNQDDISLRLNTGDLDVRFLPLGEGVLRLLTSDGYRAFRDLRQSKKAQIDSVAQRMGVAAPGLALVTFFGSRQGVRFEPQFLAINASGQQLRPIGIVPMSANFSNQQLGNREQASAIFIFDRPLPLSQEFTLVYLAASTDAWRARLTVIARERDRISARIRAGVPPDSAAMP